MTNNNPDRLQQVLDAYGSDPGNWPEADRMALAGSSPVEGEAAEIDRILAAAADRPVPSPAARDNLLAAVAATPQLAPVQTAAANTNNPFGIGRLAAASTLAASLMIGLYAGTLGTLDPVIQDIDQVFAAEEDSFNDPFDLNSLLNDAAEESG